MRFGAKRNQAPNRMVRKKFNNILSACLIPLLYKTTYREHIQYRRYNTKSKNLYCTHQPGGLTLILIILINLLRLFITAIFLMKIIQKI